MSRNVEVAEILHSGILRAQQTAEMLAGYLQPPGGVRPRDGLLPDDDPAIVKMELDAALQPVLLVGHLPFLGRLTSLLISGDVEQSPDGFTPATMVYCAKIGATWRLQWQIGPSDD